MFSKRGYNSQEEKMQRSNPGGRPVPAPIFNHKKRQRQAMFADPQFSDKQASNSSCPDLMPVPGVNRRNEGNQNTNYGNCPMSGNDAGIGSKFNYHNATNTGSSMFNHQDQNRYTNQRADSTNRQQNSRGGFSSNHGYSACNQPSPSNTAVKQEWQQQRGSQNLLFSDNMDDMFDSVIEDSNGGNSSHWEQSRNTTSSKSNQYSQRTQNRGSSINSRAPPGGRPKPSSSTSTNMWGNVSTQVGPMAGCPAPEPPSMFTQHNNNQYSKTNPTSTKYAAQSVSQGSVQSKKAKIEDVDRSLKVLTLTTNSIKKWHQMNNQLSPVLFEVFGIIDSAVLKDKTGSGKEFLLRDKEGKLQCVFYEIDRELPRLIRGQWHRFVGSMDSRTGYLKCVSVRPATSEERQMAMSAEQASQKTLMTLIQHSREQ